jgi:fused signal recognition particle receptor
MQPEILIAAGVVVVVLMVVGLLLWRRKPEPSLSDTKTVPTRTSRSPLGAAIRRAWSGGLDEDAWESLETALLAADVGVEATNVIVEKVRQTRPEDVDQAWAALRGALREELAGRERALDLNGSPATILVVGVNGTGKTTTIAKLAHRLGREGRTVVLGAADTFRAAAGEQLAAWGERIGVPVVTGQEGGDPAAVAHDTLDSARARQVDVAIIDTAGRLHGKKNLMAELQKIHRVAGGDRVDEVLLVLDSTAGQNGLAQVREFTAAVPVSGIVLTKLDGSAKGGIVIAVERSLGVPVKYVGVGEGVDDLVEFDPDGFVDSLLE